MTYISTLMVFETRNNAVLGSSARARTCTVCCMNVRLRSTEVNGLSAEL